MIQETITGTVLKTGNQRVRIPVEVEMAFDEENDPLAVQMIFKADGEDETCWVMGRELIMRGSCSALPHGMGDVKFRAEPDLDRVLVCLSSPGGHADVALNRTELIGFLNQTQAVCKLGDEPIEALMDQELKELLEG